MKEQFENIDGIFRDKLNNISPTPPDGSWDVINASLKNNSKVFVMKWWHAAASFVAIAVASVVIWNSTKHISTSPEKVNEVAITNNIENKESGFDQKENQTIIDNKEEKVLNTSKDKIEDKKLSTVEKQKTSNREKGVKSKRNIIGNVKSQSKSLAVTNIENTETSSELLADLTSISSEILPATLLYDMKKSYSIPFVTKEKEEDKKRFISDFTIGGHVTPTLSYRNNGGANSGMSESPAMFSSGGLYVEGQLNDKFQVKTGFYILQLGSYQDFYYVRKAYDQVYVSTSPWEQPAVAEPLYYVSFDNAIGTVELEEGIAVRSNEEEEDYQQLTVSDKTNISENKELISSEYATNSRNYDALAIDKSFTKVEDQTAQRIKNIEIPLIFSYNFLNTKKLSLNVISGFSANIVTQSSFYRVKDNMQLGSYDNIKNVNYSTSIGFGIEYPLMNKINLSIEPTFKYFINSINNVGIDKVHPYLFGVYTGLKYKI